MSAPVGFGNIPAELRALKQWVNWDWETKENGEPTKVPKQPNGYNAKSTEPKTWNTFERVCQTNGEPAGKIGFVFSAENGYVGIDLDKCRDKKTEVTEQWALDIIQELDTYTELSQSATGWHLIVRGKLPPSGRHPKDSHVEMYSEGRFFCTTGTIQNGLGRPTIEARDVLKLHARMMAKEFVFEKRKRSAKRKPNGEVDESAEDWRLIGEVYKRERSSDADIIEAALREKYPEHYEERNRTKRSRGGKNYFRYSIENFLALKTKQGTALADGSKITDAGNADLLVAAHTDDLRYCFEMKQWFFWDGKRWQRDDKQRARMLMEETMRERVASLARTGTTPREISDACACLDTYRLTNGLHEAEKKLGVPAAELDKHKFLLTFENGTLDLETMKLREHRLTDLITKMVHCNYNPQAPRPEKFLALLKHALRENGLPYIQKLLGYSLTADTSEKIFMIVQGEGDTGKTTFLEIVRGALKDYAVLLQVDA